MADKIHSFGPSQSGGVNYGFHCPGCNYGHPFDVPKWSWNGSLDKPTFTPSLMVNQGHKSQCHSVVTDGMIAFCSDSNHSLAGQTVELPDWED
jgi:hypothetical protein